MIQFDWALGWQETRGEGVVAAGEVCTAVSGLRSRTAGRAVGSALLLFAVLGLSGCGNGSGDGAGELLHVSYDVTRELFREVNPTVVDAIAGEGKVPVRINQSHGGSSSQARAVIDGLEGDVVSLATWLDVDAIRKQGLIDAGWESEFPFGASPFHSTVVFLVRKGNPKQIRDWPDLVKGDVKVITPNPKTSGNGKLSFLAAWGSVVTRGGSEEEAREFVRTLYDHAPILETGGRGATTAFVQKRMGDVQLAWENEAWFAVEESGGSVEVVYPPVSIRAEPHVAIVHDNARRHGTEEVARAYVQSLYSPEAQALYAKHHLRPSDPAALEAAAERFPAIEMFGIESVAGDWNAAQSKYFSDGGEFDQFYKGR